MARPAVAVVVVCHDSAGDLAATLPALTPQLGPGDELVVVDNASRDGTASAARELAPGATVIETGANLGFAGGCHAGARASTAHLLLFLNPDAVPALLAFEGALLAAAWRGGWLGARLRAQAAVIRLLPAMLRRRRAVQATRRAEVG